MNLLALVQKFATRTGIPSPAFVVGNTDSQIVQILGLVEEVLEDLGDTPWAASIQEAVFTTVAAEDQGAVATLAPNGFKWVVQDTIYDRTLRLPIYGPVMANKWQALKAVPNAGPFYKYRFVRGHLLMNPTPAAGHTCAFEYASRYLVVAVDGTTFREFPSVDTDNFVLDATLVLAGLRWKWKHEKGLDYAEEFRRYEELKTNAAGRDATKPTLSMDGGVGNVQPGIFVPAGNWSVP